MTTWSWELIYEMAVQFRPLTVRQGDRDIVIKCDGRGEIVDYWACRSLEIEGEGFVQLQREYRGKFSLRKVREIWHKFMEELLGMEM